MEWFLTPKGEAVFGEIGCRPAGAHLVDQMNYTCDVDLFREWARVACHQKFEGNTEPKYNVGIVFKRAMGKGRITGIDGLGKWLHDAYGDDVVLVDLLPVGVPRRDWRATVMGDGWVVVRHHDLQRVIEMTERFAADLHLYAG